MNKNYYFGLVALSFFALIATVFATVPNSTNEDTIQTYANSTSVVRADYIVCDQDYFWQYNNTLYNVTNAISNILGLNATNEWGLVYGTTGDWFNYTDLQGAIPVYIGLQMHPLNDTVGGEILIPQVYDKDDYHWQLALYYTNSTQYTGADVLVMYYAHIEWDNLDGLTYITPSDQEPA